MQDQSQMQLQLSLPIFYALRELNIMKNLEKKAV